MHSLKYVITNLSPLVISSRFGDMNMVKTETHIPGRAVLGILAEQFIRKQGNRAHAHENKLFCEWFLSGVLEVGPAWILSKDENGEPFVHVPIPISIQEKKNEGEIFDLLYVDEDFQEQTKGIQGFCRLEQDALYLAQVETSLNFHHARDRETGASKEGIIFNYESIAPGQRFEGTLRGPSEALEQFQQVCGDRWTAHLGRSRNAQYGTVDFLILNPTPEPLPVPSMTGDEIALTLLSDTIILNDRGYSTTDIKALETYLRGAKVKRAFLRQGQVEHFVGIWQLKQPSETCFCAGSSFLLDVSPCQPGDLADLEMAGLGERTHEGFGRCALGFQTEERLRKETPEQKLRAPAGTIPQKTKHILEELARNAIRKAVELEAMLDAQGFRAPLPSRSLCGRLESMAKSLPQDRFVKGVESLRRTAKNQLIECNNDNKTLYDFLTEPAMSVGAVLKRPGNQGLTDVCRKAGFKPSADKAFESELTRLYFCTFFTSMRKTLKKGGSDYDR